MAQDNPADALLLPGGSGGTSSQSVDPESFGPGPARFVHPRSQPNALTISATRPNRGDGSPGDSVRLAAGQISGAWSGFQLQFTTEITTDAIARSFNTFPQFIDNLREIGGDNSVLHATWRVLGFDAAGTQVIDTGWNGPI